MSQPVASEGSSSNVPSCLVNILRVGDNNAKCTMTLIRADNNDQDSAEHHPVILVDCGDPWDTDILIDSLAKLNCTVDNVEYVVCSHGHGDHVANMSLFKKAVHIVGYDVFTRDGFRLHDFRGGVPYVISKAVEVIATPGHTNQDVSVIVKRARLDEATLARTATSAQNCLQSQVVAIVGDLFECELDLRYPELWQSSSDDVVTQLSYRNDVLQLADVIVPGHGDAFTVLPEHRSPPDAYRAKHCDQSGR